MGKLSFMVALAGIAGSIGVGVVLGLLVGLIAGAWTRDSRRGVKAGLIAAAVPVGLMTVVTLIGGVLALFR